MLFYYLLDRELNTYLNGNKVFEQKKQINKSKEKELDLFSWKKRSKMQRQTYASKWNWIYSGPSN